MLHKLLAQSPILIPTGTNDTTATESGFCISEQQCEPYGQFDESLICTREGACVCVCVCVGGGGWVGGGLSL